MVPPKQALWVRPCLPGPHPSKETTKRHVILAPFALAFLLVPQAHRDLSASNYHEQAQPHAAGAYHGSLGYHSDAEYHGGFEYHKNYHFSYPGALAQA